MANYLDRPTPANAVQWDGTNAAACQAVFNVGDPATGGNAFLVDAAGNASVIIYHTSYPVALSDWVINRGTRPYSNADFNRFFVAGSAWVIAP